MLVFDEYYSIMLGNLVLFTRHILTTDIFDNEKYDFLLKDSIEFANNPKCCDNIDSILTLFSQL